MRKLNCNPTVNRRKELLQKYRIETNASRNELQNMTRNVHLQQKNRRNMNFQILDDLLKDAVVQLNSLPDADREEILSDMQDWETYMFCKEGHERSQRVLFPEQLPAIRSSGLSRNESYIFYKVEDELSETKRIALSKNNINLYSTQNNDSNASNLTNSEIRRIENWEEKINNKSSEEEEKLKRFLANIEKAKGNKAYADQDYEEACKCYSKCISYGYYLTDAYNNRAQANMKICNFTSALPDLNEVLKLDPKNVKALYRRATCRKHMKMYHEAMKDLDTLIKFCNTKCATDLRKEIENITRSLKEKSYRLRENSDLRSTFNVDISQLLAYAEANKEFINYAIEINKTGCLKTCVCNFCIPEDRLNAQSTNSLRIGERPRWKPLTFKLLDEMKIKYNVTANSDDYKANSKDNVINISKTTTTDINKNEVVLQTNDINKTTDTKCHNMNEDQLKIQEIQKLQRTGGVDRRIKNLNLTNNLMEDCANKKVTRINLKNIQPSLFEKIYGNSINVSTFTSIMNSICTDFDPENDWNLLVLYLEKIANVNEFENLIKLIDEQTKNDIIRMVTKISLVKQSKGIHTWLYDLKRL